MPPPASQPRPPAPNTGGPAADPERTVAGELSGAAAVGGDRVPTLTSAEAEAAATEPERPTVPGYQILGVLGRGAMGVVYKARQVGLGRYVALKMILGGAHASPEEMVRFLAEAEAVARLQHTNIVQIHQIGRHGEVPFFSLEYVEGGTLAERLGGAPQPPREVARLVEALARAMHCAHQQGIVHRDLKPANVLLAPGEPAGPSRPPAGGEEDPRRAPPLADCVPKITDFGLAKRVEGDHGLTRTGAILGTPSYMAPEQARGDKHVGPPADIYALGALLYEMLTGRPPLQAPTPIDTVLQVLSTEPVAPTRLQPGCPRDLETICLKCLHKEPARRYATAEALADDLQRFLTDRPILARRTGSVERLRRWCRRNPVVAGMTAAVAVLLLLLAVGASVAALWLHRERDNALDHLRRAEDAERLRTEQLATSYLEQARARRYSRQAGQRFPSLQALTEAARIVRGMSLNDREREERLRELRNEAIACLTLADLRPQRRLADVFIDNHGTGFQKAVAFAPRWETYARAEEGGPISIRRLEDDREILRLPGTGPSAYILTFSPDGRHLAAKYFRGEQPIEYVIWDWRSRRAVVHQSCSPGRHPTLDFAFTPDGREILLGCRRDSSLGCYDLKTGKEVRQLTTGLSGPWVLALHPDGRRLAIANNRTVIICDARTGAAVSAPWQLPINPWSLAWDGGGDLLAAGCGTRIYLRDTATGQDRGVLEGHEATPVKLAFNPTGTLLASAGWDGTLRLWDPVTARELLHIPGDFLEFSPDGRRLALVKGRELRIEEVAENGVCRLLAQPAGINRTHFSPEGRILASAAPDDTHLWDVKSGRRLARLGLATSYEAVFHPSGDSLIVSSSAGLFRWLVRRGPEENGHWRIGPAAAIPLPITNRLEGLCVDASGDRLAVVESMRKVLVLDRNRKAPRAITNHPRSNYIDLSPDGRWLATSTFKGTDVKVWDLAGKDDRKPAATFRAGDRASAFFSRDNRWLVVDEPVQMVRYFYQVGSWKLARQEAIAPGEGGVAFGADPRVMATTTGGGRQIRLCDPTTGQDWAALPSLQGQHLASLNFSPDGSLLAARASSCVQLWNLRALRQRLAEMDLDWTSAPYPPPDPAGERPLPAVTITGWGEAKPRPAPVAVVPLPQRRRTATPDEIARWLKQLGDADAGVRREAEDALAEVGPPTVPALTTVAGGPKGVRRDRALVILDRVAAAEALAPTRVRLQFDEVLPADAFRALAEQSGLPITYVPTVGAGPPKPISLQLGDVSAWEALDRLCKAADRGFTYQGLSKLRVSRQVAQPNPAPGYAGPFRLRLLGAFHYRSVTFYQDKPYPSESLGVNLELLKEPRVPLLSVQQPRLTVARDDRGQDLLPGTPRGNYRAFFQDDIRIQLPQLTLKPSRQGRENRKIRLIEGVLPVEVMVRKQTLATVPDLRRAAGQTFHGVRGHRLTLESVQASGNQWVLLVRLSGPPGWAFDSKTQGLELIDARGRTVRFSSPWLAPRPLSASPPDATALLATAPLAPSLSRVPWPALGLHASQPNRSEWTGTLQCFVPGAFEGPVKLRMYRFERVRTEIPFTLRDLPLP